MYQHLSFLLKAEDPTQYAKLANEGVLLGYPVKINGASHRPDNNIQYHSSIKHFDQTKDHPHSIHALARHLEFNAPDAKNTQIGFDTFKDRFGKDVHVITLHGNSATKLKEANGKFAHMGFPSKFEWIPHISVDKETHERLKNSGAKTAQEAGIEFGPAVLKKGPKVLKTYHHEADSAEPAVPDHGDMSSRLKIAKTEALEKSAIKNAGIALGMAGALAGASHRTESATTPSVQRAPAYDHKKMLRTIAQVESGDKTDVQHKAMGGMHQGGHAYGKYGLTEPTIKDVIKGHKDLKAKYGKALALTGKNLHNFMADNKGLEDVVADRHLSHMEHVVGPNPTPEHLGYGWLEGATGLVKAKKSGTNIKDHWHAKKIRAAYDKVK